MVGSGDKIIETNFAAGTEVLPGQHVILITDQPKMPNIIGWSLREVHQFSEILELNLETIGHGYITTQSIKKGTKLKSGDYLGVELELPMDNED